MFILCIIFWIACSNEDKGGITLDSNTKKSLIFNRLDKDIQALKQDVSQARLDTLAKKYPEFFEVYVQYILNFGSLQDPALQLYFSNYLKDQGVQDLFQRTQTQFADLSDIQLKLNMAFSKYDVFFKGAMSIPEVTFYISGFNYYQGQIAPKKIAVTQHQLGIGLDMYLGSDYEVYSQYGFPNYFRETMSADYLISDAVKGWIYTEFDTLFGKPDQTFLDQLILHGKMLYITRQVTSDEPLYTLFGFIPQKMIWCEDNERQMWTQLVNKNVLHSKNPAEIEPYFLDGPFSKDFPKESPAKAVQYIGYQIVRSYCEQHNCDDALKLIKTNNNVIFSSSKYKPAK